MNKQEILTLQLGSASNFIGAHWWNIQESSFVFSADEPALSDESRINHNVLFRAGQNQQRQTTFTPRMIAVDYRESIGTRDLSAGLYTPKPIASTEAQPLVSWEGKCFVSPQSETSSNQFLADLESERRSGVRNLVEKKFYHLDPVVKSWSDIARVPYHPRSLLTFPFDGKEGQEVSKFADGFSLFEKDYFVETYEDRIRKFVEETDALQGFHLLYDVHSSFSGISTWIQEHLNDEYRRKPILACPVFVQAVKSLAPGPERQNFVWNVAQNLAKIDSDSSLVLSLSLLGNIWEALDKSVDHWPFLHFNKKLLYHTGAIIAAALDTASSSWRLLNDHDHLTEVFTHLKASGSFFSSLGMAMPLEIPCETSLAKYCASLIEKKDFMKFHSISPCNGDVAEAVQSASRFSVRGMKSLDFKSDLKDTHEFRGIKTPTEVLYECLKRQSTNLSIYVGNEPVHTKAPFPNLFLPNVSEHGLISSINRAPNTPVRAVPAVTELKSVANNADEFLEGLNAQLGSLDYQKLRVDKDYFDDVTSRISQICCNV